MYTETGEAGWRWVKDQVRWAEDGPLLPETPGGEAPYRDGYHSGLAGLAHVLAEIRLARGLEPDEQALADAVAARLDSAARTQTDASFFDGLAGTVGALVALGGDASPALARLGELLGPDGWASPALEPPAFVAGAPAHDVGLGTAGVLLAAVWGGDDELAGRAADVLVAQGLDEAPGGRGRAWPMVAAEHRLEGRSLMPNFSHGTAGAAAALAVAGRVLDRPDLVDGAARGGTHLVALADPEVEGLAVPVLNPPNPDWDGEEVTWGWCHGAAGTSLLYAALDLAGVGDVAGEPPAHWRSECWRAVRASGIPERLRPGFWDNDGRCCGTAGVADAALDAWLATGDDRHRDLAERCGQALVERAERDGDRACWRFVEHRRDDQLLPPGTGWFQGAAGIAAVLLRLGRTLEEGPAARSVPRMETWWALPGGVSNLPRRPG